MTGQMMIEAAAKDRVTASSYVKTESCDESYEV